MRLDVRAESIKACFKGERELGPGSGKQPPTRALVPFAAARTFPQGVGDGPQAAGAESAVGPRAGRSIKPESASNSRSCLEGEGTGTFMAQVL